MVEAFQPICEVQSDKASIEITSRYGGAVQRLHHAQGDMVKVCFPCLCFRVFGLCVPVHVLLILRGR